MLKYYIALILLLLIPIAIAQTTGIKIAVVGYGSNGQDVYFSFTNTGDTTITGVNVSVDGKEYKELAATFIPGKTIADVFFLSEGQHLIEARTPDGAHDSLNVTVARQNVQAPPEQGNQETPKKAFRLSSMEIAIIMIAIATISLVLVWKLIKKSK